MKLQSVEIEHYRAIKQLNLELHPHINVIHGINTSGKTSVLSAIAVGLDAIPSLLPGGSGLRFKDSDRRDGEPLPRVALSTTTGIEWERDAFYQDQQSPRRSNFGSDGLQQLESALAGLINPQQAIEPVDLPVSTFYETERMMFDQPIPKADISTIFSRYAALKDALSGRPDFQDLFVWFYEKENRELRIQRDRSDFKFKFHDLDAVRSAITSMVPHISDPQVVVEQLQFGVDLQYGPGKQSKLVFDQLSGGFRTMLALSADIAKRMAQANPHYSDPLESEAIVLIDEIELHLHPAWQQRVLIDLVRTFPNVQFIVTTHSPHVLGTVKPHNIIELSRYEERIVPLHTNAATYGAKAGDVLFDVMGVEERAESTEFVSILRQYTDLVSQEQGESEQALSFRSQLEKLSPRDSAFDRIDMEIQRQKMLKKFRSTR